MTMSPLQWTLLGMAAAVALLYGLWVVIPVLHGLPWIPTGRERIRRALEMARVRPGEIVYDLGAGDGRVLVMAAREFGAQAVGIEASPLHCAVAWLRALFSGSLSRVRVRRGNFFRADLRDADVVFAYLTSRHVLRLQPQLERQLRPGTRVVTISFDFPDWQPAAFDKKDLIFLYRMPPDAGGLGTFLAKQDLPLSR
ncbi:MAG: methyltransferase domain-containing protein [Chloroflexi bacterium]|nr:methyltransferase domain-containing protein [Chloroflexota bacterium]